MMDHYRTLGLGLDASKEEIKEAFRRSALKFHPDKHSRSSREVREGASLKFKQASEAYQVLIDDRKRADYDLSRRLGRTPSSSSSYYGYGGGSSSSYYRPPPPPPRRDRTSGFDAGSVFRYVTRRGFLLNVAFASALLGGAILIEKGGEALWKMNNSGKSFEEALQSVEKGKIQKEKN